jgi:deoxycytidine triphosphate deaminase
MFLSEREIRERAQKGDMLTDPLPQEGQISENWLQLHVGRHFMRSLYSGAGSIDLSVAMPVSKSVRQRRMETALDGERSPCQKI